MTIEGDDDQAASPGRQRKMELKRSDPNHIRQHFGVVMERMVLELRGISCLPLEEVVPDRKKSIASHSFGRAVQTRQEMEEAVSAYATRSAEKMRRQHLATASLVVFVETNSFRPQDAQYHASKLVQLPVATADTGTLIAAAMRAVSAICRSGYRYKKAGVMLLDLGLPRPSRSVRCSRRLPVEGSYESSRCSQRSLWPRYRHLRRCRPRARMETKTRPVIEALHDGLG